MYHNQEYKNRFRILKGGLISLVVASNLYGAPTGGTVVSGSATISQIGNTTNINQSTQKASINWQDFSIAKTESVNFNQPNQNSITLNRVVGNEKSIIDGALNANGQVWILNSNGTLFGKNAKVNTSGLLVTTKELKDQDFQDGNYNFKGDSIASIENQGEINLNDKAYAVFVANSVVNSGEIKIYKGNVHLIGADEFSVTLNENSNISLKVNKGVFDALVENNNLIISNGGNVYLTTNAKDELLKGVVNNTGIIEASSLDDLTQSEVILFAHGGTANISGEIIAKNSFVETSGKNLSVKDSFKIEAKTWLLDPTNITIASNGTTPVDDVNSSSGDVTVSATAVQNALSTTDVNLQADNNITVNQNITWSEATQLKLSADNINVNAIINNTNSINGGVYFQAGNTSDKVIFGTNGKVIVNNVYQLQWINQALNGKYELGSNIDASATSSWNSNGSGGYYGFNPIGNSSNSFTGTLDGKNYAISDLYINRDIVMPYPPPLPSNYGLFGYTGSSSIIKNVGLENAYIRGYRVAGGLVGWNNGRIENSYSIGINISTQSSYAGGLVGGNGGDIINSYATGTISGHNSIGGLVGFNSGNITNSYALADVGIGNSSVNVGGLVGYFNSGTVRDSFASGTTNGSTNIGGLIGYYNGAGPTVINSWFDNANTAFMNINDGKGKSKAEIVTLIGGASSEWSIDSSQGRGYGSGGTTALPFLINVTRFENTLFEDGFGTSTSPYTITNWTQLQNINNFNILTQNYYFNLLNNLDSQTSDYTNLAGNTANGGLGWHPIGDNYTSDIVTRFRGTFDGLGNTISDLYINRLENFIGLFGYLHNDATIKNIGLLNTNITGTYYVGGLAGRNYGTISNSYATGAVNGNMDVGGLAGRNYGTISNSYATGIVKGSTIVGGLVGYNYDGTITNSYASGTVSGTLNVGGLVGVNNGTITNSFYDKTKAGETSSITGVTALTTQQMSYGQIFKNASWDIVADSSVTSTTPIIKYDSVNSKYVWAIAPLALTYTLSDKSTTYDGQNQNLNSFYSSNPLIIPIGYEFLNLTSSDYKFQVNGTDVIGYKDAGTYSNIKVALNGTNEFLTIASSGNTDGKLTITPKSITVVADDKSKVYGEINPNLTYSTNGLIGDDTLNGSLTTIATVNSNVGTYDITQGNLVNSNYNLSFTNGKLTIAKANATVTANSNSLVYNGTSQSVSGFEVTGLVNGETKDILTGLTGITITGTNVGTYSSNIGGSDTNYNLTFNQGNLIITPNNSVQKIVDNMSNIKTLDISENKTLVEIKNNENSINLPFIGTSEGIKQTIDQLSAQYGELN